ncbi:MAG: succinate dehydrogenase iron-sulfur subunit [Nitrospinaceae bacterium]
MATFRIKRFNPEKQPEPYYEEFQLDIPSGATLLDCMNLIKWTLDGSLSYRMSCRSAICGSCAIKVDGHAMLACQRQAEHLVKNDETITLEPLGNLKPIKDLVVDFNPFWEKINKVKPYLETKETPPEKERLQSPQEFRLIDDSSTCIMCGACYSDCNTLEVDENFLGPAALAKAQRFVGDSRDSKTLERVQALSEPGGIWDCTHCGECVERCPKPARPFDRIKEIMTVALDEGVTNNVGARHAMSFFNSVKRSGNLNENRIPVESMGIFNIQGLLSLLPVGLRMFFKGKVPPIIHHSIEEVDDVKRIFKELDQ